MSDRRGPSAASSSRGGLAGVGGSSSAATARTPANVKPPPAYDMEGGSKQGPGPPLARGTGSAYAPNRKPSPARRVVTTRQADPGQVSPLGRVRGPVGRGRKPSPLRSVSPHLVRVVASDSTVTSSGAAAKGAGSAEGARATDAAEGAPLLHQKGGYPGGAVPAQERGAVDAAEQARLVRRANPPRPPPQPPPGPSVSPRVPSGDLDLDHMLWTPRDSSGSEHSSSTGDDGVPLLGNTEGGVNFSVRSDGAGRSSRGGGRGGYGPDEDGRLMLMLDDATHRMLGGGPLVGDYGERESSGASELMGLLEMETPSVSNMGSALDVATGGAGSQPSDAGAGPHYGWHGPHHHYGGVPSILEGAGGEDTDTDTDSEGSPSVDERGPGRTPPGVRPHHGAQGGIPRHLMPRQQQQGDRGGGQEGEGGAEGASSRGYGDEGGDPLAVPAAGSLVGVRAASSSHYEVTLTPTATQASLGSGSGSGGALFEGVLEDTLLLHAGRAGRPGVAGVGPQLPFSASSSSSSSHGHADDGAVNTQLEDVHLQVPLVPPLATTGGDASLALLALGRARVSGGSLGSGLVASPTLAGSRGMDPEARRNEHEGMRASRLRTAGGMSFESIGPSVSSAEGPKSPEGVAADSMAGRWPGGRARTGSGMSFESIGPSISVAGAGWEHKPAVASPREGHDWAPRASLAAEISGSVLGAAGPGGMAPLPSASSSASAGSSGSSTPAAPPPNPVGDNMGAALMAVLARTQAGEPEVGTMASDASAPAHRAGGTPHSSSDTHSSSSSGPSPSRGQHQPQQAEPRHLYQQPQPPRADWQQQHHASSSGSTSGSTSSSASPSTGPPRMDARKGGLLRTASREEKKRRKAAAAAGASATAAVAAASVITRSQQGAGVGGPGGEEGDEPLSSPRVAARALAAFKQSFNDALSRTMRRRRGVEVTDVAEATSTAMSPRSGAGLVQYGDTEGDREGGVELPSSRAVESGAAPAGGFPTFELPEPPQARRSGTAEPSKGPGAQSRALAGSGAEPGYAASSASGSSLPPRWRSGPGGGDVGSGYALPPPIATAQLGGSSRGVRPRGTPPQQSPGWDTGSAGVALPSERDGGEPARPSSDAMAGGRYRGPITPRYIPHSVAGTMDAISKAFGGPLGGDEEPGWSETDSDSSFKSADEQLSPPAYAAERGGQSDPHKKGRRRGGAPEDPGPLVEPYTPATKESMRAETGLAPPPRRLVGVSRQPAELRMGEPRPRLRRDVGEDEGDAEMEASPMMSPQAGFISPIAVGTLGFGVPQAGLVVQTGTALASIPASQLIFRPPPEHAGIVLCYIVRDKSSSLMHPTYTLYRQGRGGDQPDEMMLCARKQRRGLRMHFSVCLFKESLDREGDANQVGTVHSNFMGSRFTIHDSGHGRDEETGSPSASSRVLAGVSYASTATTAVGSFRHMTVAVPRMHASGAGGYQAGSLAEEWENMPVSDVHLLASKPPIVRRVHGQVRYYCRFGGRVKKTSVKNFQLIEQNGNPDRIIMQFGKVSDDLFVMDYRYPLSGEQAFGIALTSLDSKLCFAI